MVRYGYGYGDLLFDFLSLSFLSLSPLQTKIRLLPTNGPNLEMLELLEGESAVRARGGREYMLLFVASLPLSIVSHNLRILSELITESGWNMASVRYRGKF